MKFRIAAFAACLVATSAWAQVLLSPNGVVAAGGGVIVPGSGSALIPVIPLPPGYFVAVSGSDANPGTIGQPFATIQKAITTIVNAGVGSQQRTIYVRGGTYSFASQSSVGLCSGSTFTTAIQFNINN